MPVKIIPKGSKYGKLTTTGKYEIKNHYAYFECICECGTVKWLKGKDLNYGSYKSCGCYGKEQRRKSTIKHNLSNSRLYGIWNDMRTRCNKAYTNNYLNYGGRGISVCSEWDNTNDGFLNFYNWAIKNGYKEHLTIDRINVNGNYEPSNCRWATMAEQSRNKRNNRYFIIDGIKKTMTDLAKDNGINPKTLQGRIDRGYSIEDAISKEKPNKRIIIYEGKEMTPKEFSEKFDINYNTIMTRITSGCTDCKELLKKNRISNICKPVNQYDLQGNYIASFSSASEAARKNNCCKSGVIECCNGKKKKFLNWVFRYQEQEQKWD